MSKAWDGVIEMPSAGRTEKPRDAGVTMVIDKGVGLHQLEDLIQIASGYIDIIKLTFGTSAFYDKDLLKKKNEMITSFNIDVMPGGTFLEVAVWKGVVDDYLKRAKELGFSAIEISDGTIEIDRETRRDVIKKCLDQDFRVLTEVGKKDPKEILPISLVHQIIAEDMENGAFKVIVEAREAGKGVGIYDQEGNIKSDEVDNIVGGVEDINCLIWEAPLKNQQQELILRLGINANLGNIPPDEILALEALRQGVRGDTLKRAYLETKS
ncbi:MAG: phosphosulfolactate synthase [Candidatus Aminicenantes bacterium]|nr:MAG: phosphosulfolactate synthase [Candidatus Aminicenantes bacterium]